MTDLTRLTAALADRYRIERELGQGGMATVYLAQDLKHDRKVALKVLRPELAAVLGAERFVQEIRTTAALQHPHILPLFDSGQAVVPPLRDAERGIGGEVFLYYVMPYVEGETLRAKLDRETQLGIEEAVRITTEVADALDYAHRHGVIHRDIKPENILLHDGRATVADFGIALALSAAAGGRMTETGLSLGTPHYMSPEQATAEKELTNRSDIYSLGSVLYEMLTGSPPHTGASAQQIIMKIVTEEAAPVTTLRRSVPTNVAAAVAKAVERLPADRFASAAEFAHALKDPQFRGDAGSVGAAHDRSAIPGLTWRDWRIWVGAAALMLVAGVGGRWTAPTNSGKRLVARFAIPVGAEGGITGAAVNALAVSPDGGTIVFAGRGAVGDVGRLYERRLDEMSARPIAGTEGGTFPTFSPDGKRLAFIGPGGIFVLTVPFTGGSAGLVPNSAAQELSSILWLDDQTLLTVNSRGGIARLTLDGVATTIAEPDRAGGEKNLFLAAVLPDRRTMLAIASRGNNIVGPLVAIDARNGHRTPVLDRPVNAAWYADGCLLWSLPSGVLQGATFDLQRLRLSGATGTIAEGVQQEIGGPAQAAVSSSGALVYVPESPLSLVLLDRSGRRDVLAEGHRFHSPRFSPDGRRLALDFTQQGFRDVWTFDLRQRTLSRLTFENDGHDPVWSHDGRWVAFSHGAGIWRRASDGSGAADSVYTGPAAEQVLEYTPDGKMIAAALGANGTFDIAVVSPDGAHVQPLLTTPYSEEAATLSRDGRWLAYSSDETGRAEVYVRQFPGGGAKVLVSNGGGTEPRWAPDGRILYYEGPVGGVPSLVAAAVAPGPEFGIRARTPLFAVTDFEPASPHANWDLSPDGTHFVMARQASLGTVMFVLNWTEAVRQHPAGEK
ncbi:MAG TPA: protein kinase [Gemmatimonadales bacterium]|nr:protein kinase [Gemmatimonadales bacterium]